MRAGLLKDRITVQRPVEARSGSGEITTTWEDWRTVWADVRPLNGRKLIAADAVQSNLTHEIRLRYQHGFRTNQRVKFEAEPGVFQYMAIESVVPIEQDRDRLSFMCELREAAGWRT